MASKTGTTLERQKPTGELRNFLDPLNPGTYFDHGPARLYGIDDVLELEARRRGRKVGDDEFQLVATDGGLIFCRASICFAIAARWRDLALRRADERGDGSGRVDLPIDWPGHGRLTFTVSPRLGSNVYRRWLHVREQNDRRSQVDGEVTGDEFQPGSEPTGSNTISFAAEPGTSAVGIGSSVAPDVEAHSAGADSLAEFTVVSTSDDGDRMPDGESVPFAARPWSEPGLELRGGETLFVEPGRRSAYDATEVGSTAGPTSIESVAFDGIDHAGDVGDVGGEIEAAGMSDPLGGDGVEDVGGDIAEADTDDDTDGNCDTDGSYTAGEHVGDELIESDVGDEVEARVRDDIGGERDDGHEAGSHRGDDRLVLGEDLAEGYVDYADRFSDHEIVDPHQTIRQPAEMGVVEAVSQPDVGDDVGDDRAVADSVFALGGASQPAPSTVSGPGSGPGGERTGPTHNLLAPATGGGPGAGTSRPGTFSRGLSGDGAVDGEATVAELWHRNKVSILAGASLVILLAVALSNLVGRGDGSDKIEAGESASVTIPERSGSSGIPAEAEPTSTTTTEPQAPLVIEGLTTSVSGAAGVPEESGQVASGGTSADQGNVESANTGQSGDVAICHSNYGGCVPVAADVDCEGDGDGPAFLTEPVVVFGEDVYDLDTDDDREACEMGQPLSTPVDR